VRTEFSYGSLLENGHLEDRERDGRITRMNVKDVGFAQMRNTWTWLRILFSG
jgi:hypothetical protein